MNATWIIAQCIGFIGTGSMLLSFQMKKNKKYYFLQLTYKILYIVHYYLLGALSGSLSIFLSLIRNALLLSNRKEARWKGWVVLLSVGVIFFTIRSWKNGYSILPAIAMIVMTIANWTRNGRTIRLLNLLVGSPAWLIYDFSCQSIPGIIAESLCILSILISIIRFGWRGLEDDSKKMEQNGTEKD